MLVAHMPKEENMQKKKDAKRRRPPKPFAPGGYELFHNGLYRQKIIPDKKKAEKRKRKKVDMREYQPFFVGASVGSFPLFKNSGILPCPYLSCSDYNILTKTQVSSFIMR